MKKDNYITEVMFRKVKTGDFKGDIEAVFPYEIADTKGNIMSYAHIGQHSAACWDWVLFNTIPAKEDEYKNLKRELESFYGYNFKIVKRRNYNKFKIALNKTRQ